MTLEKGDIVQHVNGEVMRVLKVYELYAVLETTPRTVQMGWLKYEWSRQICAIDNLSQYPSGKVIFDWIDQKKQQQLTLF